jgi:type VI secretion system protein
VSERSLLERLRRPAAEAARRSVEDPRERAASVLAHLQRMLNTRRGNVLVAPEYGAPDLTDIVGGFPESVAGVEQAIKRSVERYEPRLRDVRVTYRPQEDDPLTLGFEIAARMTLDGGAQTVSFVTRLTPEGRFEVKI